MVVTALILRRSRLIRGAAHGLPSNEGVQMTSRMLLRGLAILFVLSAAHAFSEEPMDLAAIHRIKTEALENSKVMEHVFYLTDANGPRLTNSPGFKSAGDWVVKRLQEYGLSDVHEEALGALWPRLDLHALRWTHDRTGVCATHRISVGLVSRNNGPGGG